MADKGDVGGGVVARGVTATWGEGVGVLVGEGCEYAGYMCRSPSLTFCRSGTDNPDSSV